MRKNSVRILALLAAAALAAGCGSMSSSRPETSDPLPAEGEIGVSLGAEPDTIDPALVASSDEASYALHLFEGLTAYASDGTLVAACASGWKVETDEDYGQPVYTFTLRDGLLWSDGEALTASDFVYAWRRAADPATASPYAYLFSYLRGGTDVLSGKAEPDTLGVEAVDDTTLRVTLEGPCPYFTQLLALPVFAPVREDCLEQSPTGWTNSAVTCVGNGPYRLESWQHDGALTVVKNENYRGASTVSIGRIHFYLKSTPEEMEASFQSGALQFVSAFPDHLYAQAQEDGILFERPVAESHYYLFNTNSKTLSSAVVRKALMLAADRSALVTPGRKAAMSVVPDGMVVTGRKSAFVSSAKEYDDSVLADASAAVEQAVALLSGEGYPGGAGLGEIDLITNDSESAVAAAEAIAAGWEKELGVKVKVEALGYDEFLARRAAGQFDVARGGTVADFADPSAILELFISTFSANWYNNDDYDALIAATLTETSAEQREASLAEAEYKLMSDAAVLPLLRGVTCGLCAPSLTGVKTTPLGAVSFAAASLAS